MSFDKIISRKNTGSYKFELRPELDPFWIADMDFESPPEVTEALKERVAHGVFGYPCAQPSLIEALSGYLKNRHSYELNEDKLIHLGGMVPALSLAARAFGEAGGELLTCGPVYPPFLSVAKDAEMKTVVVPHIEDDGKWTFDWDALEKAVTAKTRLFLLCSPQNPLGRCFSKQEIIKIAEFCLRHRIILVSDEIHCDLVLDEEKTPFFSALNLSDKLRQNSIVLLAPSKTYNIAGLGYTFGVIENDKLRASFKAAKGHTLPEINCFAYVAAEAAYRYGEPWRVDLLAYLRKNRDTITEFINSEIEGASIHDMEATYLAWIDCSCLGIKNPAKHLEKAGIFVSDGAYFGAPDHIRFNFGCPHSRVLEGLEKIEAGFALK